MKVLFKTANRKDLVAQNVFCHLEQRISEFVTTSRNDNPEDFDWVLYTPWTSSEEVPPPKIPKDRSYKTVAIISDLHTHHRFERTPEKYIKYLNENFDVVLSLYGEMATKPYYFKHHMKVPYIFFSPWVETEYYKAAINQPKEYDVILIANVGLPTYPFRSCVARDLMRIAKKNDWKVLLKGRPKGLSANRKISELYDKGEFVGKKYVETLGKSKIMICGSSIYKYPLMRYFEGMICKTLVFGDTPQFATELGLIDRYSFVEADCDSWETRLDMYLNEYNDLRRDIIENAYRIVLNRHTCKIRAKQFIEILEVNS